MSSCFDCIYFRSYGICFDEDNDWYSYKCHFDKINIKDKGDSDYSDIEICENFKIKT